MDKISVVIPVYNTDEKLLDNCVKSVLFQTYENLDIIIVDDGSNKESTVNKCAELLQCDSRIQLIRQKNKGESGARKTGIDAAVGEFVVFLDSDDCLYADACEYLHELITSGEYGLAEAGVSEVFQTGKLPVRELEKPIIKTVDSTERLLWHLCENSSAPMSWSVWGKIYKTAVLQESYTVYSDIYRGVDVLTLANYAALTKKLIYSDKIIAVYNKGNEESITAQKHDLKNLSMLKFWKEMIECYNKYADTKAIKKVNAIYADCLAGCLLECKLYKYDNYSVIGKEILRELRHNYKNVLWNSFAPHRVKLIIVMICPWIFDIYWWIKG